LAPLNKSNLNSGFDEGQAQAVVETMNFDSVAEKLFPTKDIKEIKGDDVSFEKGDGTLFTKKMDEILGKVEGVKPEGQEDLVKKLGELKTKKPEDIKKVSQYVDFINDEKNKDKIVELDKIINAGEGA
jgi:LPS O-antigen subunit length determinant protein (WzzB/FepE family)